MPPPSLGGVALIEMLNVLEGYDLKGGRFASAAQIHLMTESMKRAYATAPGSSAIPISTRTCRSTG